MSSSIPAPSVLATKKELNLYAKSWVRDSHVSEVAAILKQNSSLTFVGFRECRGVSDSGAVAIAQALYDNSTVKKINFESTKVGNRGVCALAQALVESSRCALLRLDLAYCPVGDEGAMTLARLLSVESCPLQVLHLDYCPKVSDTSGNALVESLTENESSRMTIVGLKGTSVSALVRGQVDSILKSKTARNKDKSLRRSRSGANSTNEKSLHQTSRNEQSHPPSQSDNESQIINKIYAVQSANSRGTPPSPPSSHISDLTRLRAEREETSINCPRKYIGKYEMGVCSERSSMISSQRRNSNPNRKVKRENVDK